MRLVGLVVIVLAVPMFVAWMRAGSRQRALAYAAFAAMPFFISAANLDAALIDWSQWPGYTKGAIVTLIDSLALAIIATHSRTRMSAWLWAPFWLYLGAAALSVLSAGVWMASTFYVFQLVRVFIAVLAIAAAAKDIGAVRAMGSGLAAAMILEAAYSIYERAGGAAQAAGTLPHQNLLGMMSHFALFPLFGMVLAGERRKLAMLGIVASLVVVALGGSRATIGLTGAGLVILLVLSTARRASPRKLQVMAGTVVTLGLAAVLAVGSLSSRFGGANDITKSDSERTSLARAAHMMIDDHPMGVGANQYVLIANSGGYSQRAGVVWNVGSRAANVHDFFLLTWAEMGWLGVAAAWFWLLAAMLLAIWYAWRDRRDPRGEIHLGIAVAVLTAVAHNLYEWIFVTSEVQYLLALNLGIATGLAAAWQAERRAARRPATAPAASRLSPAAGLAS